MLILLVTAFILEVNSSISPVTFIYSLFGLRRPYSSYDCILTNLPENVCSISSGMEVAAWPPNSPEMFFLYYSTCNAILDKRIFAVKPFIKYKYAFEGYFYTIMVLDRDKKGLDKGEYYLLYLACNIDGYDLQRGLMWDERVMMRYKPPNPPADDGYHRILFVIYIQSSYLPEDMPNILQWRDYFNIRLWMRHQPIYFCGPLAGVQMETNYL